MKKKGKGKGNKIISIDKKKFEAKEDQLMYLVTFKKGLYAMLLNNTRGIKFLTSSSGRMDNARKYSAFCLADTLAKRNLSYLK